MSHAIVLVSGGIDSAVCFALAAQEYDRVTPVHFRYGQRTADIELQRASLLTSHYRNETDTEVGGLEIVEYYDVFRHFAGGLTDPDKDFSHMVDDDGRSAGFVPMRNLHLIATGAAIADVRDADAVFHGAQGGDEADYPDCRPDFMDKAAGAINKSLADDDYIDLRVPVISLSKVEVIQKGDELGVPFEFTYSCYEDSNLDDPQPCGACPACEERGEAFTEAGVEDPVGTPEVLGLKAD